MQRKFGNYLRKKYITEDVGAKKFMTGKFLKYAMVDSNTIIKQVEELQILIYDSLAVGCSINKHFQVGAIIEKLSPSWKDFKIYLKHKRKDVYGGSDFEALSCGGSQER
ncbi:unnamed protein product [Prunus armeniaca]